MNESTLTQLKIIVERAVRPLRASLSRKRKMREELLAHVTAVFEEESRQADESAALERTAQRFGSPAELTPQLQAAVPAGDVAQRFLESWIGFPPREPALRQATRLGLLMAGYCAALLAVTTAVIEGPRTDWLSIERMPALFTPLSLGGLMFCAVLIWRGMSEALLGPNGRDWPRVIALGVAAWLLVPGVALVGCFLLTGGFLSSLREAMPLLLPGLLAPLALLIAVGVGIPTIRYHEEWARLPIESGSLGAGSE